MQIGAGVVSDLDGEAKASRTCAFCGFRGTLTGEHVLGSWLSKIGLDLTPVPVEPTGV